MSLTIMSGSIYMGYSVSTAVGAYIGAPGHTKDISDVPPRAKFRVGRGVQSYICGEDGTTIARTLSQFFRRGSEHQFDTPGKMGDSARA
ncbi:hypothetical protein MAPG_05324 [Magnaporthiopsis poae ATCC 64411]|uniref:Uncharacterized protein n=1 Tax=Magnaporthiopsis poae (strain ATCC 64411 / 73-15) TaxID=644358 RepID=A0A0C4DZ36_MAGP6|nr:hypothetical protein MAPG_05324 [Magnaporthiopsis poae ATCC 64411]